MRSTPADTASQRRRAPHPLKAHAFLLATLITTLLLCAGRAFSEDEPKKDEDPKAPKAEGEKKDDGAPKDAAPGKREPIIPQIQADPRAFKELAEAAQQYFDLDEEPWRGRMALIEQLEAHAAAGRWFLKDMDALRWLVGEGRSFQGPLTDRKWQRAQGITDAKSLPGTLYWLKSEDLTLTFSVPRDYPKPADFRKYPRPARLPLLLTLHRKSDAAEKYPGEALMKRLYGDKKIWKDLYDQWLVLAPIAAAGNFVIDDMPRPEVFLEPFSVFWKHYHVDFDRVILDGEDAAFAVATSMPVFFAGIIFRGKWTLRDDQLALVKNFGPVPVFVVDNPELAKQLEDAGHPNVTKGIANAALVTWMDAQRRVTPKAFEWNARRVDQVLPYWINLDAPNWSAPERTIKVEIVDTPEQPNTIKVQASGISDMSFFLNDEIVDLDRKVRLEINGHIEHDAIIALQDERMTKIGRDFDFLFSREPLDIRDSMYFGWLTPARIVRVNVRAAEVKEEPKPPVVVGPQASPEQEEMAERYLFKARAFVQQGNVDGAKEYLAKILELPRNAQTEEAGKLLEELGKK